MAWSLGFGVKVKLVICFAVWVRPSQAIVIQLRVIIKVGSRRSFRITTVVAVELRIVFEVRVLSEASTGR